MTNVVIRPAGEKDIPFILKAVTATDSLAVIKQKRGLTAEYIHRDIFSAQPKAYIIVATVDGEPVANLLYSFFYLGSVGQVMWISKVYIDPFCRKMNIGPALRDYLSEKFPEVPAFYGSVVTNNKIARMFFSSLGGKKLNNDYVFYRVPNQLCKEDV